MEKNTSAADIAKMSAWHCGASGLESAAFAASSQVWQDPRHKDPLSAASTISINMTSKKLDKICPSQFCFISTL